ncbi:type I-F CRISPR-associated protein Csy3 [Undibacterium danionis]|uniref:Type I-F CRISPR-associated protein Csy3 n=1 Tax=Undibacterium danionis TaxID=1812100 RepID=A0ABV6IH88_9BURK
MAKNDNMIASVLAFEKKLVSSDGYLYGTTWEKRTQESTPLNLIEKSVRGTISNRLKPAIQNDPLKLNAEVEKANLQKVDACALGEHQDTLKLHFTLKVLGGVETPSACNNALFKQSYETVAKNYIEQEGFTELARRYAINIANGRYLWRNRIGAEKIEVHVQIGSEHWIFDANEFSTRHFDSSHSDVQVLADKIAETLSGKAPAFLISVNAYALVGIAQEVYPSEELVLDKGKGDKSKILYAVKDVAAMHSQKIGNALRSIDTWYPEFETANIGPIAIEPYGAVTNLGKAYRTPKEKLDFYSLFDRFALGEKLASKEQEHYVMGVLVRGGVFGQSSKE